VGTAAPAVASTSRAKHGPVAATAVPQQASTPPCDVSGEDHASQPGASAETLEVPSDFGCDDLRPAASATRDSGKHLEPDAERFGSLEQVRQEAEAGTELTRSALGPRQVRKRVVQRRSATGAAERAPVSTHPPSDAAPRSGTSVEGTNTGQSGQDAWHPAGASGPDAPETPAAFITSAAVPESTGADLRWTPAPSSEHLTRGAVVMRSPQVDGPATAVIKRCPNCGGDDLEFGSSSGQTACMLCGHVVEENTVVNELQFVEGAGGHSAVVGQFVRTGSSGAASLGAAAAATAAGASLLYNASTAGVTRLTIGHRESRELTYAAGRRRIATIASQLHLPPRFVDAAHRLFTLAVQHNFVQGRRTQTVAAAALYIVCRREKTPHLLIDFSDTLRINVYVLGHTYLKLCRVLHLALPIIDPSFYIHRFASRLDLGEKQNAVAQTALRLISRMKRDWIHTGRRPAGLCGAALLIAARMHGFRRSQREIGAVVRVGDMTIRQRLCEIEETPTGTLTGRELAAESGLIESVAEEDTTEAPLAATADTSANAVSPEAVDTLDGCDPPAFRRRHALSSSSSLEWLEQQHHVLEQSKAAEQDIVADTSLTEQERAFLEASATAEGERVPVTVLVAPATSHGAVSNYVGSVRREASGPLAPLGAAADERAANPVTTGVIAGTSGLSTRSGPEGGANYRWLSDRVEELSDLDSEEEAMFVCTPEETAFREKIWTAMNQEWIEREAEIARWERDDPERYQRLMRKREYMRGFYKSNASNSAAAEAPWSHSATATAAAAAAVATTTTAAAAAAAAAAAPGGERPSTVAPAAVEAVVRSVRDAVRSAVTHSKRTSKKINYDALEQYDLGGRGDSIPTNDAETVAVADAAGRPSQPAPSLFDFGDQPAPERRPPVAQSSIPAPTRVAKRVVRQQQHHQQQQQRAASATPQPTHQT
jgi:transcription initiation factor TFIIIB Brf1 subunit/transcription initiation factor TFIIB